MIRITQSMQIARTLLDQNLNMERLNEYNNNMSSRTTLHRPSDDPIRVARAMRIETELNVNETYKQDLQAAESWSLKTDASLSSISDIIKRVRELAVQAASGEKTNEDKQKIEAEIAELKESAIQIGNDDYMGRYQFSGNKTNIKFLTKDGKYNPQLDLVGLKYEKIHYNIGVGQKTNINITGVDVFGHENFTTKARATDGPPFKDALSTTIGATMNIKLQKYKRPENSYTLVPQNNSQDALEEQNKKYEIEEKYEKTMELTQKDGAEIDLDGISFNGEYKNGDVNSIIDDMNKALMDKIDQQFQANKPMAEELKKSIKFVNDDGKIAIVTDGDYSAKITPINGETFIPNQGDDIKPKREMMPFFEMMDRLSRFMKEGDSKGISRMIEVIDEHAKNNQKNQGIGGAKTNMYKIMLDRAEDIKLNYNSVLSETRDTDYNEMSMKMMVAQYVYRASLSVTAKIIQPSLVDFLR